MTRPNHETRTIGHLRVEIMPDYAFADAWAIEIQRNGKTIATLGNLAEAAIETTLASMLVSTKIKPGALIEATIASTKPRTIRRRVKRCWPVNPRSTTLITDHGPITVYSDSIRVVEEPPTVAELQRKQAIVEDARDRAAATGTPAPDSGMPGYAEWRRRVLLAVGEQD
ncbi:hypothetical protein EDD29_0081 [Actinocorallia herbida]|uniref:Uncharacterized protein n=1 Tax=Actinocorallia herbida TaxID=58109 RepID=A0A3N1CMS2_9ACTN|nr:hypothetical protein [Actinocorallia herbida]ROO82600.1 hypothetical protein EDD29_0081 [Actinocorallia herbida]